MLVLDILFFCVAGKASSTDAPLVLDKPNVATLWADTLVARRNAPKPWVGNMLVIDHDLRCHYRRPFIVPPIATSIARASGLSIFAGKSDMAAGMMCDFRASIIWYCSQ